MYDFVSKKDNASFYFSHRNKLSNFFWYSHIFHRDKRKYKRKNQNDEKND